jgi:hypothetical protein
VKNERKTYWREYKKVENKCKKDKKNKEGLEKEKNTIMDTKKRRRNRPRRRQRKEGEQ